MKYQHSKFSSLSFIRPPIKHDVDGYQINTLSFCLPENAHKNPIVFLGGAFQTFISFKKDVQALVNDFPIILMDLPSQGQNEQLAPQLEFTDFAHLIAKFCEQNNLEKINPVGLSYGSASAFYFANLYPDKVERVVLGGTTPKVRDSLRVLLGETFNLLDQNDMESFSTGVVMNLINFPKKHITEISDRILGSFKKHMLNLKENEKSRYIHNTKRLLRTSVIDGTIKAPALVFTGELDNFTTPRENYQMSQKCENGNFVLIKNGDHLSNLERREEMASLYSSFFKGQSLDEVEGIRVIKDFNEEARLEERKYPQNASVLITDKRGLTLSCMAKDINHSGCALITKNGLENLDTSDFLTLEFENRLTIDAHPLTNDKAPRFIFRRASFKLADQISQYVNSI